MAKTKKSPKVKKKSRGILTGVTGGALTATGAGTTGLVEHMFRKPTYRMREGRVTAPGPVDGSLRSWYQSSKGLFRQPYALRRMINKNAHAQTNYQGRHLSLKEAAKQTRGGARDIRLIGPILAATGAGLLYKSHKSRKAYKKTKTRGKN